MKNFLKFFVIAVCAFLCVTFFVGCDEIHLNSIDVSISSQYATLGEGDRFYTIQFSSDPIPLNIDLSPNGFSTKDLFWSSNSTDVAYVNSENKLVTLGEGSATIYVSYKNSDRSVISSYIKVFVTKKAIPKFRHDTYVATYSAEDLSGEEYSRVANEDSDTYSYLYYYNNGINLTPVANITNAGEYIIKYCLKNDPNSIVDEMSLSVSKAKIQLTSLNCQSVYGDEEFKSQVKTIYPVSSLESNLPNALSEDIVSSLGQDNGKVIGKYCYTTTASQYSTAGNVYETSVYYELDNEYSKNYSISKVNARHTVSRRSLFVVLNDETIIYGDEMPTNAFSLYDGVYDENEQLSSYTEIDKDVYLSNRDIVARSYAYYYQNRLANKNGYGRLDVLTPGETYDIKYSDLTTSSNITLSAVVEGKLTIEKRDVVVLPINPTGEKNGSFGKTYGQADNLSQVQLNVGDDFAFANEINSCILFVDYDGNGERIPGANYSQSCGKYCYGIESSNNNINWIIHERATSEYLGSDPVRFEVFPCQITFGLEHKTMQYVSHGSAVPDVKYYGAFDFKMGIKSLEVNGESVISNGVYNEESIYCHKSDNYETTGEFVLNNTEDIFSFDMIVTKLDSVANSNTFESFSVSWELKTSVESNFYTFGENEVYLNLTKIVLAVAPKQEGGNNHEIYTGMEISSWSNYTNNLVLVDDTLGFDIDDILSSTNGILTLKTGADSNQYYVTSTGEMRKTSTDAGEYKVFMAEGIAYSYKTEDKSCYTFALDTSQEYFFSIDPLEVVVRPEEGNKKVYGNKDGSIAYKVFKRSDNTEVSVVSSSGNLHRQSGENVGTYLIDSLGTLDFGSNYSMLFDNTANVVYSITARELSISPYNSTIVYGSIYPTSPASYGEFDVQVVGDYDENILVLPNKYEQFSGSFALGAVDKINGLYPVGTHNITLGTFEYSGYLDSQTNSMIQNYVVKLSDTTAYCTILKKRLNLEVLSQRVDELPSYVSASGSVDWNLAVDGDKFSASGLVDGDNITLTGSYISTPSLVYIDRTQPLMIAITRSGEDVLNCYDYRLNNNTMFYINTEIIRISILPKSTAVVREGCIYVVYNGSSQSDLFDIVAQGSNGTTYNLTSDCLTALKDNSTNSVGLVYVKNDIASTQTTPRPTDAGSYTLNLVIDNSLTLKFQKTGDSTIHEFTAFNTTVDNCYLEPATPGYLVIEKADLIPSGYVEFDGDFVYGGSRDSLPDINTSAFGASTNLMQLQLVQNRDISKISNYYVFRSGEYVLATNADFEDESIPLYERGVHYEYLYSDYELSQMPVGGTNCVRIKVQRATNVDGTIVDTNYNPYIVELPLSVSARKIYVDGNPTFDISRGGVALTDNYAQYNGNSLTWKMNVTAYDNDIKRNEIDPIDEANYVNIGGVYYLISNSYDRQNSIMLLDFEYKDDSPISCVLKAYDFDKNNKSVQSTYTPIELSRIDLDNDPIDATTITGYVIIGDHCFKLLQHSGNIIDSGVYIFTSVLTAKNNYEFFMTSSGETTSRISKSTLFEMKRSDCSSFLLTSNVKEFYVGTIINYNNASNIINLFDLAMSPNYISKLKFSANWTSYTLPVQSSDYVLQATLDDTSDRDIKNLYFTADIKFKIVKCQAIINDPATSNWTYTGLPISNFLNEISVTLVDADGSKKTNSYFSLSSNFDVCEIHDTISDNVWDAKAGEYPYKTGTYELHLLYQDEKYLSPEHIFTYSIIPRPYTGKVSTFITTFPYDPTDSFDVVYSRLMSNIRIDGKLVEDATSVVKEVQIFLGHVEDASQEEGIGITLLKVTDTTSEQDLLEKLMSVDENGREITYKVVFQSSEFSDSYNRQYLFVTKRQIETSDYTLGDGTLYYTGQGQYWGITYANVNMSPYYGDNEHAGSDESTFDQIVGSTTYKVTTKKSSKRIESKGNIEVTTYEVSTIDGLGNEVITITYSYYTKDADDEWVENILTPLSPNEYHVLYTISGSRNYILGSADTKITQEVWFEINKQDSINVVYESSINSVVYNDGANLTTEILAATGIYAQGSSGNLIKLALSNESGSYDFNSYQESAGIVLRYGIYAKGGMSPLNSVTQAGEYVLRINSVSSGVYDVNNYTNLLKFNNVTTSSITIQVVVQKKAFDLSNEDFMSHTNIMDYSIQTISENLQSLEAIRVGKTPIMQCDDEYSFVVYNNNNGSVGEMVEDFATEGFASSTITTGRAYVFVYKKSGGVVNDNYSPVKLWFVITNAI